MSIPTFLGPYALIREIGEGGLAKVYLALKDGRPYAVKCLKSDQLQKPAALQSFVNEIKIASRLEHANIPKIVDEGKTFDKDGQIIHFSVMELVVGLGLIEIINTAQAQQTPLPLPLILHIINECCSTLHYVHSTSIFDHSYTMLFHGDFSPENLLLTREGSVSLLDFGSAGQGSGFDPIHRHMGKLHYLPPEILAGKSVSSATDIYALAVLAYYLLFGKRPYEAQTKFELFEAIKSAPLPRLEAEHLVQSKTDQQHLRLFFNTALNKDPNLRFKSVAEFRDQLLRIRFNASLPATVMDATKYYPASAQQAMQQLEEGWMQSVRHYQSEGHMVPTTKRPIESLLTHVDRRRHPRVSVDPVKVYTEIVAATERMKVQFGVHELSQGGMLLRWQGLPPNLGEQYPLTLHFGKNSTPIKGMGKLLYEVSRDHRSYVGMQCSWNQNSDATVVSKFVIDTLSPHQHLLHQTHLQSDQQYLDVFFSSLQDFKKEFEKNIRYGGLFVQSPHAFQPESKIIIRVQLPDRLGKILLSGKIVYSNPVAVPMHGIGVQLEASETQLRSLFKQELV